MAGTLPPNPSIDNLKKQARALQKLWRSGDPEALARVRAVHPRYRAASDRQIRDTRPRLTDCQLVLAREAGYGTVGARLR